MVRNKRFRKYLITYINCVVAFTLSCIKFVKWEMWFFLPWKKHHRKVTFFLLVSDGCVLWLFFMWKHLAKTDFHYSLKCVKFHVYHFSHFPLYPTFSSLFHPLPPLRGKLWDGKMILCALREKWLTYGVWQQQEHTPFSLIPVKWVTLRWRDESGVWCSMRRHFSEALAKGMMPLLLCLRVQNDKWWKGIFVRPKQKALTLSVWRFGFLENFPWGQTHTHSQFSSEE